MQTEAAATETVAPDWREEVAKLMSALGQWRNEKARLQEELGRLYRFGSSLALDRDVPAEVRALREKIAGSEEQARIAAERVRQLVAEAIQAFNSEQRVSAAEFTNHKLSAREHLEKFLNHWFALNRVVEDGTEATRAFNEVLTKIEQSLGGPTLSRAAGLGFAKPEFSFDEFRSGDFEGVCRILVSRLS